MSSVPQNRPIPSVQSPLEIAKAIGAQHKPGFGVNGREKGADRRGGMRLAEDLASRAEKTTDPVEITPSAKLAAQAAPCMECGRPTLGSFGPAPQRNYWRVICQTCKDKADQAAEQVAVGMAARIDTAVRVALGLPVNKPDLTDLGDGLGLPLAAHNGREGELASEGERPFILSEPVQTEIGATHREFVVRTSTRPTAEQIRDMQIRLGFHPGGYGEPRDIRTLEDGGACLTYWLCDRSCD